jgi:hypothetical protein
MIEVAKKEMEVGGQGLRAKCPGLRDGKGGGGRLQIANCKN